MSERMGTARWKWITDILDSPEVSEAMADLHAGSSAYRGTSTMTPAVGMIYQKFQNVILPDMYAQGVPREKALRHVLSAIQDVGIKQYTPQAQLKNSTEHSGKSMNEMGCGGAGVMGFQLPLGIKQRKKKLDKVMESHTDIKMSHMLVFLRELDENSANDVCEKLDTDKIDEVANDIRESCVRQVVRQRLHEVVRKKDGKYVLYAPNKGKKKKSKSIRSFSSKLAAKRAELAQFPPGDRKRAEKLRKEVDRLTKNPKKAAEKERKEARKEMAQRIGKLVEEITRELSNGKK